MSKLIHQPSHVIIGRLSRPHGVQGELKVEVMSADPDRFSQLETVFLGRKPDQPLERFDIASYRQNHNQVLLHFKGINNREDAGRLRGLLIFVPLAEAIPLAEGEFFIFQLYGMTVVTDDGRALGTIQEVIQTGANDVFVVNGGEYGEVLIPDTAEVVLSINGPERLVTVNLLDGLLPD
jgi:16S rRNA processing protein RimM